MARVGKQDEGPDPDVMPTVGDLVNAALDRGAKVTSLSAQMGVDRSWVYQLRDNTVKNFPEPENIERYARALGVKVETLLLAFAKTFDLPLDRASRLALLMPAGSDMLTEEETAALVELIRAMVRARDDRVHGLRSDATWPAAEVDVLVETHEDADHLRLQRAAKRGSSEGQRRRALQDEQAERE
jgi:hypothetical protein